MSGTLVLVPFDWARFDGLRRSLAARDAAATAQLLAQGPAHRDPDAPGRLAALARMPVRIPGAILPVGLEADPPRFAAEAARWLADLDERVAAPILARASATADARELPIEKELLVGGCADDRGARGAPAALVTALGGLAPGVTWCDPLAVRALVPGLDAIDVAALPRPGRDARVELVDPDGDLDELVRHVVRDVVAAYREAAAAGSAMLVIG